MGCLLVLLYLLHHHNLHHLSFHPPLPAIHLLLPLAITHLFWFFILVELITLINLINFLIILIISPYKMNHPHHPIPNLVPECFGPVQF